MASAGPYASLHLAPDRQPRQHPTTLSFLRPDAHFLLPNQQRQSTEGISTEGNNNNISNLIIIAAAIQLTSGHHQILKIVFYPHDAVLTRYESKSCVCHKLVFYWNGWMMELVSGMEASTDLSNTTIQGNLSICKNNVTSFWQFIQTLLYGHLPLLVYRHKVLSS